MPPRSNRHAPAAEPVPSDHWPERGTVTALKPQRRAGRLNLHVDGLFCFGIDAEVAAQFGLAVGVEVDRAQLESARSLDEEKQARDRAFRYLGARPHTRAELARKLQRRQLSPEAVERALDYLAARGWIDDHAFARQYVEEFRSGRGARGERRLAHDLRRKGVPPAVVAEVLAESFSADDGLTAALELAQSRLPRLRGLDRRTAYRRLVGFLARRGYSGEVVSAVVSQVLGDHDDEATDVL